MMMNIAPASINEQERLNALSEYFILDTSPEDAFDDITAIASHLCNTPISFISVIDADRQWFRSCFGSHIADIDRTNAFCNHPINIPTEFMVINDLTKDERFNTHPLVTGAPHAVFYAGVPLVNPEGYTLGTLCVVDTKARQLTDAQIKMLRSLASQAVCTLELRKAKQQLRQKERELGHAYGDLEKIAHIASHDLKSPLNNIISLTHLLNDGYSKKLDEEGNEYISFLNDASYQLSDLVSGIVSYTRSSQMSVSHREEIDVPQMLAEVTTALSIPPNATVTYQKTPASITAPRLPLKLILTQLLHNAIQYNSSEQIKVNIDFHQSRHACTFEIKDNGNGIEEADQEKIFDLFERLHKKIKDGESMGMGLAIAKRLAEKCGGEIKVTSEINKGSTFTVTLPG